MPSSGPLSLGGTTNPVSVASELGLGLTTTISMNDAAVRTLAGAGSSGTAWSMNSLYGKSNIFSFNISANQTNANLRTLAVAAGWNQSTAVVATVNAGVYVYATSISNGGLTINGSWPGGVTLVNNGYIMGQGGMGMGTISKATQAGGPAISLGVSCTITNNSYIGGGGGGGDWNTQAGGGGGAGGGQGGGYIGGISGGGAGGGPGSAGGTGGNGQSGNDQAGAGGGGGRIMPGTGGAGGDPGQGGSGGGSGGGGGGYVTGKGGSASGYAGGSAGSAGSASLGFSGSGGGGWGASGGSGGQDGGGAAGKAIALNGFTATRNGSGTTYGAVS